jgi:L-fuconolactonase
VVGWEDLSSPHLAANVAQWGRDKLVGFRHQVQDEADVTAFLEAPAFNAGIKWLQQQGLVYDVLVYARQMAEVQAFCARHDATGWCWITWASRPWPTSAAAKLLSMTGSASCAPGRLAACGLQAVGTGDRGRLVARIAPEGLRQYRPVPGHGAGSLRPATPDVRIGLAGMPAGRFLCQGGGVVREWAATRLSAAEQEQLWGDCGALLRSEIMRGRRRR